MRERERERERERASEREGERERARERERERGEKVAERPDLKAGRGSATRWGKAGQRLGGYRVLGEGIAQRSRRRNVG